MTAITIFCFILLTIVCGAALMMMHSAEYSRIDVGGAEEYARDALTPKGKSRHDMPKPQRKEPPKPDDTGAEAWAIIHVETYNGEQYTLSSERFHDEWRNYPIRSSWGVWGDCVTYYWNDEDGICYEAETKWEHKTARQKLIEWTHRNAPTNWHCDFWGSDTVSIRVQDVKAYRIEEFNND